ncbi:Lrp/AsnC family transcriptional regulator [Erythrobacter sp. F6033]|uniref:Lrp/AsnC family transcriptional regulator n=1 Tax=Erythrobacter sp. F6033 TaxID=2926401 RepID=UPI001FF0E608|nr:Lrp/AsnC family transcriptional regulator [Erythrobacter sp. F6033]MCK0127151.1 Lrp/AsnC family transcriptional regulator [Erythrobacter sp. F6033]
MIDFGQIIYEMIGNAHLTLDATDRRILREVQTNLRRSPDEIAAAAGVSVSSYRRRLKRLRASGVILKEVAIVEPAIDGIEIIVLVTMIEEHSDGYDRLARRARRSPEVTQCYSVTGEADLILHVHMPDMRTFESWIRENVIGDAAVKRCTSHVVYSRMKFETAITI